MYVNYSTDVRLLLRHPVSNQPLFILDCARYVELSTTSGTKFENIGIVAGAAPTVFKLDPDMDLSGTEHYTAVYKCVCVLTALFYWVTHK